MLDEELYQVLLITNLGLRVHSQMKMHRAFHINNEITLATDDIGDILTVFVIA